MATALDVFSRALRLIAVKDANDTVDSSISDDSILALNQMMSRWEDDGLDLGFTPIAVPADTVTVAAGALEPIAFNLAITLAPEFGYPVPDYITAKAMEGYALLLAGSLEMLDDGTVEAAIRRALRLVGIPAKAYYVNAGIMVLNQMMARWSRDGLGTNYVFVTAITDDLDCQVEAREPVIFNLAVAMAMEYGKDPPPGVVMTARDGYKAVLRDSQGWVHADWSQVPQTRYGFDITNG